MLWLFALVLAALSVDLWNILLVQVCLVVLRSLETDEQQPKARSAAAPRRLAALRALRLSV